MPIQIICNRNLKIALTSNFKDAEKNTLHVFVSFMCPVFDFVVIDLQQIDYFLLEIKVVLTITTPRVQIDRNV